MLKIASAGELAATIEFHAHALVHLERRAPELPIARMVPSLAGELVPVLELDGKPHSMRLVTYLPGVTFDDDQPISTAGMRAIGTLVGSLVDGAGRFRSSGGARVHAVGHRQRSDPRRRAVGRVSVTTPARSGARPPTTVGGAIETMSTLPRQIIHNDGHAGNLLRSDSTSDLVTGVIDFGDLVHTVTVADLGVSGANLVPHQVDPVAALAALTAGFHAKRPLCDAEVAALPDLVLARLALSTLLVEYQIANAPHIADAVAARAPRFAGQPRAMAGTRPTLEVVDRIGEAL